MEIDVSLMMRQELGIWRSAEGTTCTVERISLKLSFSTSCCHRLLMSYNVVRLSVIIADRTVSVGMATTAVAHVACRSAGEVTCYLPTAGARKKLSYFLLAAVGTDACHRRSVTLHRTIFSARCNIYISRLCYDVSGRAARGRIISRHASQC